jgi:hydrogenase-4 component B
LNLPWLVEAGVPAAALIRILAVSGALILFRRASAARYVALVGAILASALTFSTAVQVLLGGEPRNGILLLHSASGMALSYSVTPLSAWFLMVFGLIATPVSVYSLGHFARSIAPSRMAAVGSGFNLMLGAVELVFVAADVITFLFAWELMTLATAALVATEHQERDSRRAGYLYLVVSHVGAGCLFAGFLTLAAATGSLSFSTLFTGTALSGWSRDVVFVLFFVGFGVKAGIMPLHILLPEADPVAPSGIGALMSSVLITAGVYGLVRVCALGLGVPSVNWGLALMGLGALSAILGVLYALTQKDLMRVLAYSSIENVGIMVLALGAGMLALAQGRPELAAAAVAASLVHVLNHAVFKGLLFLGAGSVAMATGSRRLEQFGGLLRRMPWTGVSFLVGSMAIAGLPLLSGFVSEWLTFQALLVGFTSMPGLMRLNYPLSGALLALTSALAAACFVKVFGISFLALPRSAVAREAHESPWVMLAPQAFLATLCVALGVFPGAVMGALSAVLASLPGLSALTGIDSGFFALRSPVPSFDHLVPAVLGVMILGSLTVSSALTSRAKLGVRREPTWGCGGELSAKTEYTASAFSKPLMMVFRAVYRPTRQVETLVEGSSYFTQEVSYRAEVEPTLERYVYGPLLRAVLGVAHGMKVLQAGSIHAYLGYVLVLAVLLLLWLGGNA